MVLAHASKRPQTIHDKKRHGQHHKHSKHYTKTYWPYLPIALMVGGGVGASAALQANGGMLFASSTSANSVQTLLGNPWGAAAVLAVATLCSVLFLYRHGRLWYRAMRFSEAFVIEHPFMDIALVALGVVGFMLAGFTAV